MLLSIRRLWRMYDGLYTYPFLCTYISTICITFFQERQETPFSVTPFVTQQRFTVSFSTTKLRLLNNDLVRTYMFACD